MEPSAHGGGQLYGVVITVGIVLAVMLMRNRRPRRLRLEAMWIRPLIFIVLIAATFSSGLPPLNAPTVVTLALALVLGIGAGWLRGSLMRIDVHPETHDISAQASPVGMLFILAVLGVRIYLRTAAATTPIPGLPATAVADALILLAGAMMITQSLEMWLRARRLLGEAQAAKAERAAPGQTPIVS
jgi:TRAP-type C4-dicarboxylate transport system permease small subunit